jgi:hypothetical protein
MKICYEKGNDEDGEKRGRRDKQHVRGASRNQEGKESEEDSEVRGRQRRRGREHSTGTPAHNTTPNTGALGG